MKSLKKLNNSSGFTLVELMVVIAVIAILAGIGVPKMSQFIRKARVSEVSQQAKWIGDALVEYQNSREITAVTATSIFNNFTELNYDNAATDLQVLIPTLGVITNNNFKYKIFYLEDEPNDRVEFCMRATYIGDGGAAGGAVFYSSAVTEDPTVDTQWENYLNMAEYMNTDITADPMSSGPCSGGLPTD